MVKVTDNMRDLRNRTTRKKLHAGSMRRAGKRIFGEAIELVNLAPESEHNNREKEIIKGELLQLADRTTKLWS